MGIRNYSWKNKHSYHVIKYTNLLKEKLGTFPMHVHMCNFISLEYFFLLKNNGLSKRTKNI